MVTKSYTENEILNKDSFDFVIYTDGGYSNKRDLGAWAFVILDGSGKEIMRMSKKIMHETNNRAELKAIMAGLYYLPSHDKVNVCVISDSQYALKTCCDIYARNANSDLFEWLDMFLFDKEMNIVFRRVRGHSGDKYNELCDAMCNDAVGFNLNDKSEWVRQKY